MIRVGQLGLGKVPEKHCSSIVWVPASGCVVVVCAQVALQARLMSQALRKLAGNAAKTRTTVIFVNQIRFKVGVLHLKTC